MSGTANGGTLVLVVGPSGAGKDTLIAAARQRLAGNPRYVFVRRVVTRAGNAFEDHDTMTTEQFAATVAAGGFALHWQAHGLSYGVPRGIETALTANRVVVCNVSRGLLASARKQFGKVVVIRVEASPEVLAARIAARGRDSAAGSRLDPRRADTAPADFDIVIDNSDSLTTAIIAFTQALTAIDDRP